MSVESNRYDASALVNKGNCMLQRGDMEGAVLLLGGRGRRG